MSSGTQRVKTGSGATAKAAPAARPRTPTPPPWTPSASSCFSRPEPPPLQAFGGTPRAAMVERSDDRGIDRSGLLTVPAVAMAAGTASSSVASQEPTSPRTAAPLHALWAKSARAQLPVVPPPPVGEAAPVIVAAPVVAAPVVAAPATEAVHAPVEVEISDSVPMVVLETSEEPEHEREPVVGSMLAAVLQSSIATAKMPRVIVTMPPRREAVVAAPASARRRIALALGAAAALVLAVGLTASPTASSRTEQDVARDGLALATNLVDPASALVQTWTSAAAPVEATTQVPSTVAPALVAPLPSADSRLALAVTSPVDAIAPALEPAPQPRRARRARHRGYAPAVTEVETTTEPTPAPRRSSSSRRPRPASAEELLFDGEVALRLGDAKQAYRLAKRSRNTGAHADASSLVARSACRIGERDEAKQALRDLPLLERGAVRRDCRRSGSRIGL